MRQKQKSRDSTKHFKITIQGNQKLETKLEGKTYHPSGLERSVRREKETERGRKGGKGGGGGEEIKAKF